MKEEVFMADHQLPVKVAVSVVLSAGLVVCAAVGPKYSVTSMSSDGSPQIEYKHVSAPEAANENGVVTAEEWKETYPEIVASYEANGDNTYRVSYLEEDPYLVNIYEGYGFAKDYTSAIAHNYTLTDIANTERPHALANCLTCKTADFTKLVQDLGVQAYSLNFDDVYPDMSENVGCYTCHENEEGEAGTLVVTHDYTAEKLSDDGIDSKTLVCGQCHIEYYFDPETKATTTPYDNVAAMDPDQILAYYDEMGFSDWTQESTGTGMLKAQHPELETFLGEGSRHAALGLTCASCHMEKATDEETGVAYTSHSLVSPLESETILATCAQCHKDTDMVEKVRTIQEEITGRETELGNKLSDLKDQLAAAVASGDYTEDELNELRSLYRSAQWYFDFCYVENSEGAHNSTMSRRCLDKSEELMEEANGLFKASADTGSESTAVETAASGNEPAAMQTESRSIEEMDAESTAS